MDPLGLESSLWDDIKTTVSNPFNAAQVGASFQVGGVKGLGNAAKGFGKGLLQMGANVLDATNMVAEGSTGHAMYKGDLGNAAKALTSGQVSTADYLLDTSASLATLGTIDQLKAGVDYAQGDITVDEASERIGGPALFQLGAGLLAKSAKNPDSVLNKDVKTLVSKVKAEGKTGPVKSGEHTTYQDFVDRSVVGDNLEGHEPWQHSNINEHGLATNRLSTSVSKQNPVIALEKSVHTEVNAAQRAFNARAMTPIENIKANTQIMRNLKAAPSKTIKAAERAAIKHAKEQGF